MFLRGCFEEHLAFGFVLSALASGSRERFLFEARVGFFTIRVVREGFWEAFFFLTGTELGSEAIDMKEES